MERNVDIRGHAFVVEVGSTPNDTIHWEWVHRGTWEGDTFDDIDRHVDKETFFVDIGAHIGMVSLYASAVSHHVVSVEPDVIALSSLKENIRLNKISNVEVIAKAIADGSTLTLYSDGLGNSMSNLMGKGAYREEVQTIPLSDILDKAGDCKKTFIKIDIEGFEEKIAGQIYDASKRENVTMLISLHKNLKTVSSDYLNVIADALKEFTRFECRGETVDLNWLRANGHDQAVLCLKS